MCNLAPIEPNAVNKHERKFRTPALWAPCPRGVSPVFSSGELPEVCGSLGSVRFTGFFWPGVVCAEASVAGVAAGAGFAVAFARGLAAGVSRDLCSGVGAAAAAGAALGLSTAAAATGLAVAVSAGTADLGSAAAAGVGFATAFNGEGFAAAFSGVAAGAGVETGAGDATATGLAVAFSADGLTDSAAGAAAGGGVDAGAGLGGVLEIGEKEAKPAGGFLIPAGFFATSTRPGADALTGASSSAGGSAAAAGFTIATGLAGVFAAGFSAAPAPKSFLRSASDSVAASAIVRDISSDQGKRRRWS